MSAKSYRKPDIFEATYESVEVRGRRRRWPLGADKPKEPFVWPPDPYVTITDRGVLIAIHAVEPTIFDGGMVRTGIKVGRLACLAGLFHGRLLFEVNAHLWRPNRVEPEPEGMFSDKEAQ